MSNRRECITGEGVADIFIVINHGSNGRFGICAAERGVRFAALEPLRQATHQHLGAQGMAA